MLFVFKIAENKPAANLQRVTDRLNIVIEQATF